MSEPDIDARTDPAGGGPHRAEPHGVLPPGWSRPKPEHVPRPTYWPAVMAVGITCLFWGVVTTWFISLVGLAVFALALAGWIGALDRGE
jgi:hypothetical protein